MKNLKRVWVVYILRCSDGSLYTGITVDLARRMREHACGKGSRFVRSRLPMHLVYQQPVRSHSKALRREALIKSWPRRKKLQFIRQRTAKSPIC